MAKVKGELGPLERSVMEYVWDEDRALSVRDVMQAPFAKQLAYTTLMTILDRLWKKGYLSRTRQGRAYVYVAKRSRNDHVASLVEEVLAGSKDRRNVLLGFVRGIDGDDLDELRRIIREVERERKSAR